MLRNLRTRGRPGSLRNRSKRHPPSQSARRTRLTSHHGWCRRPGRSGEDDPQKPRGTSRTRAPGFLALAPEVGLPESDPAIGAALRVALCADLRFGSEFGESFNRFEIGEVQVRATAAFEDAHVLDPSHHLQSRLVSRQRLDRRLLALRSGALISHGGDCAGGCRRRLVSDQRARREASSPARETALTRSHR